jgi:hypothetical protein
MAALGADPSLETEDSALEKSFPWLFILAGFSSFLGLYLLPAVGSTDKLDDLAREAPVRVFVGIVGVLGAPLLAFIAKRVKHGRKRLFLTAHIVMYLGIISYAWAALDISATPRAPDIAITPDRPTGTASVVVKTTRLSADELVLITAGWADVAEQGRDDVVKKGEEPTPPTDEFDGHARPDDKGVATREFQVGPLAGRRPLLVVARIIERDRPRKRGFCADNDRLCDDVRQQVPGVLQPHLDVDRDERGLTFTVSKHEQAPGPVRVIVVRGGQRVFGAARRVDNSVFERTLSLTPSRRGGERVCVAATFLEGRFRCDAPGVSSERFRLPR